MQRWSRHTQMTDPGGFSAALASLGTEPRAVVNGIQGLLIHGETLIYYGISAPTDAFDRTTLAVRDRLRSIAAADPGPFTQARPPESRSLGTCRDYALAFCAVMRTHGMPARLRCGFAAYLEAGRWEDHWLGEVLRSEWEKQQKS